MGEHPTRERLLADEIGAIRKDPGGKLRVALIYPNTYAVGMSNLGMHTVYRLLNARPDVVCERAFLPANGRVSGPLRTLESDAPLSAYDVVAFSLAFEMDYPNVPRLLGLGGIEPVAHRRRGPLVLAGGATVSCNPEPVAPFLDVAVVGEAEDILDPLVEGLKGAVAERTLDPLAGVPGVYLPGLGAAPTARLAVRDLNRVPIFNQIFTPHTEFGAMALVEIGRGCPYGCRFCAASHLYRPARWRDMAALLPAIARGLQHRDRIGLVGASVTDHPEIVPLCEEILRRGGKPSPASMRADALTADLLALLARGEVRTITLAPETAAEALRRRVGKQLSNASLFAAAERARRAGIRNLKLYFMVGLPQETDDDVAAIPALVRDLARESGLRIRVACSVFVPKPGTPFARMPMISERAAREKLEVVRRGLRELAAFSAESPRWARWQGVLARGGRELAGPLAAIAQGADTPSAWGAAFREFGLSPDEYALRIPRGAPVPWAHVGGAGCLLTDGCMQKL